MYVMFILIGFSLLVALTFLGVFIWAVRNGQFEDHYTPSVRVLFDDEKEVKSENTANNENTVKNENTSKPDTQEQRSTD
ncbi:cbb3-type cytochrome oxidase assembly protein CcoS [bacterium]|nr:cbb3-type cytochrome oxidase assembly protein CcoS [bacterium]